MLKDLLQDIYLVFIHMLLESSWSIFAKN